MRGFSGGLLLLLLLLVAVVVGVNAASRHRRHHHHRKEGETINFEPVGLTVFPLDKPLKLVATGEGVGPENYDIMVSLNGVTKHSIVLTGTRAEFTPSTFIPEGTAAGILTFELRANGVVVASCTGTAVATSVASVEDRLDFDLNRDTTDLWSKFVAMEERIKGNFIQNWNDENDEEIDVESDDDGKLWPPAFDDVRALREKVLAWSTGMDALQAKLTTTFKKKGSEISTDQNQPLYNTLDAFKGFYTVDKMKGIIERIAAITAVVNNNVVDGVPDYDLGSSKKSFDDFLLNGGSAVTSFLEVESSVESQAALLRTHTHTHHRHLHRHHRVTARAKSRLAIAAKLAISAACIVASVLTAGAFPLSAMVIGGAGFIIRMAITRLAAPANVVHLAPDASPEDREAHRKYKTGLAMDTTVQALTTTVGLIAAGPAGMVIGAAYAAGRALDYLSGNRTSDTVGLAPLPFT